MKFIELKNHLKSESLLPAYIVVGDDSLVIASAVKRFKETVVSLKEMNISEFTNFNEFQPILEALESLPLIEQRRLVIVYNYSGDTTGFSQYLKKPNQTSVLIFVEDKLKENFSKLIKQLEPVDCNRLDTGSINKIIRKQTLEASCQITEKAAELLILYTNRNLARITKELEKLCLYKMDGLIDETDVENLVSPDTDYKIFELSEAVAYRRNEKAADILKSLLESKIPPVTLLGMLYSHFRRLMFILITPPAENLPALLGVKEFAVTKAAAQAKLYTPKRLKNICDDFHKADFDFKAGLINDKLALELFVTGILQEKSA